ncbi:peptidylprolyl isomerase [Roseibium denhamense]|uniref:Parvulin-like PPIase n=1 Tax=Roseibium denhamense TaxID=76305 RepID=A0ABY1PEA8_9HYPH|nr:peptidylprolyl isomerase [Roseibium denhamense]MTI06203.1 peptidylprolyl isomerase [Roseibium denhamense]SMP32514.1 peptidyl-prolyl cis-trans isomerase D [Roseibium denhamense]
MLDALRKGAGTWIAKLFIALLIFSFAIWGVTDFLQGFGQNTAAKVGEAEVSMLAFERTYRQDMNRIGQQLGRPLTPDEGTQLGIPQQALGRLVAEAAMDNAALGLQLAISDERLAGIIQSDPAFRGLNGRYDRNRLQQVLQANMYREDEYVLERRRVAERSQLAEALSGGITAPQAYVELVDTFQSEARDIDYLELTRTDIGEIEDPSESVLATYFEDNNAQFRAPEYREIAFISMTPTSLARPGDIHEDDARAEYESRAEEFAEPERREIRQMTFQSEEEAAKVADELSGGKSFDDVMTERNLTANDVSLGTMARADFLDEALGDAAFALEEGESSGAIDGRFSTAIVNVKEILLARTTPFEEVKDQIVRDLAREQAEREILDIYDEVEDARAGGALLAEVSERFSLPLETTEPFDAAGSSMTETTVTLPDADGLLAGVFDSDIGIENDVLELNEEGFLWYEVTKVTPARDRELDEVRASVIEAWKEEELASRLSSKAADLLATAEGGTPLEDIASQEGLEVQTASGLTRNGNPSEIGREALQSAFGGPIGTTAVSDNADGTGRIVLKVTGVTVPQFDPATQQATAASDQLSQQIRDSLVGLYITEQEKLAGVEINQVGVAQVMGLSQQN